MKEVTDKTIHPSIRELLSFATSVGRVVQEYESYINNPSKMLFKMELEGEIVGCIGIEERPFNECEITHIAVASLHRGNGIGSKMIEFVSDRYSLVSAETDADAVEFYRKYGFKIESVGEKYPGVERFLCEYIKGKEE